MNFIKIYGYLVFYITEANGSVPLNNANIEIKMPSVFKSVKTDTSGKCQPIPFEFGEDDPPFFEGSLLVYTNEHRKKLIEKIVIYPGVTIVQIVNLERI